MAVRLSDILLPKCRSLIIIIKRKQILTMEDDLVSNLITLNIPLIPLNKNSNENIEVLKSLIKSNIDAYFDILNQSGSLGEVPNTTVNKVEKSVKDLLISLQRMQYSFQIPELISLVPGNIRRLLEEDVLQEGDNTILLNSLQSIANTWVGRINDIIDLSHQVKDGSVLDEINFWSTKEETLISIYKQIQSPEIVKVVDYLRSNKRSHSAINLLSNSTVRESISQSNKNTQFLKDLPYNEIISASNMEMLQLSINSLFSQMKKLKTLEYPISRAVELMEIFIIDIKFKYIEILEQSNYISLDLDTFELKEESSLTILSNFDVQLRSFVQLAREQQRKRGDSFNPLKLEGLSHLKITLMKVSDIKHSFEDISKSISQFILSIDNVLLSPSIRQSVVNELENLRLDLVSAKISSFTTEDGISQYENRFSQSLYAVEKSLINGLKSILDISIQEDNDPFEILENYGYLLKRPNIRISLNKYHARLLGSIDSTLDDIELQLKNISFIASIIESRGIPSKSTRLVFVRRAMLSLSKVASRLELILSPEWSNYPEGQKYSSKITRIISELDVENMINEWIDDVNQKLLSPFSKDYIILCDQDNDTLKLNVNLDDIEQNLLDEYNCLKVLQFDIHERFNSQYVSKLEQIIPYAISLKNAVHNLNYFVETSEILGNMEILIRPLFVSLFDGFSVLFNKSWKDIATAKQFANSGYTDGENLEILDQIDNLTSFIVDCFGKVQKLKLIRIELFKKLEGLVSCKYDKKSIALACGMIQQVVDELLIGLYPNMDEFITSLNERIKEILLNKFKSVLTELKGQWASSSLPISFELQTHQISIQNSTLMVYPPLESSKEYFFNLVNDYSDVINEQHIIKGSLQSSDVPFVMSTDFLGDYVGSLVMISASFSDATKFCDEWISLRSIWNFNIEELESILGSDLSKWLDYIHNVKNMKSKFDSMKSDERFGLINIDYGWAQSRIFNEFESWLREINLKFSTVLLNKTKSVVNQLQDVKDKIANTEIHLSNPGTVIVFLSAVHSTMNDMNMLDTEISMAKNGHHVLFQYKFKFPSDWIYFDQIQSEIDAISSLLETKKQFIRNNLDVLVSIVHDEKTNTIATTQKIISKWEKKQLSSDTDFTEAMKSIENFEKLFSDLSVRIGYVSDSYKLLELPLDMEDMLISNMVDELKDLKSVWSTIITFSNAINSINNILWDELSVTDIKSSMNEILLNSKTVPNAVNAYPAFQKIQADVKDTIRIIPLLNDLRTDAVKPYHWKEIFVSLCGIDVPSEFTVGHVLRLKPNLHEKYLRNIVANARSEKLIDDSITAINDKWVQLSFDIVLFDNKYNIITSWDHLFQYILEDLNILSSVKVSVHFERFSKRVNMLETRLDKLYTILDTWVDCQRQWVYLYGTFNGSDNIRNIMPIEVTRFDNMTLELKSLMKTIMKNNVVFEVLTVPDVQIILTRISDTLNRVKTSLAVYLEKQRDEFPRLYFIGNDDLLELIGNSKSLAIISKHIKKMFHGISSLIYDEEAMLINGVVSSDREILMLDTPVSLIKNNGLKETLVDLENTITVTLSNSTVTASSQFELSFSVNFTRDQLLEFINAYTNQVVCLSLQIFMTSHIEHSIKKNSFDFILTFANKCLKDLSSFFDDLELQSRLKIENIIIELIHYRDTIQSMMNTSDISFSSPLWFFLQKYYILPKMNPLENLTIKQGNAKLFYGYEYLGIQRKLAYTPLIDSSFVSMTESLDQNLGSMLAGPAGTGKTESIKALGYNLGRMVFVFCCDETFDYESVSRILIGISCIGAWGCFDEFNRLEGKMLSAMSTQIEKIETSLSDTNSEDVELLGKSITVSKDTGIFITNNPTYEGRTILPDNLKNKYITFNMNKPDSEIIADVIFTTQGFLNGKALASKIVQIYNLLSEICSNQIHYDFGLRSIKSVLITCGKIKRHLLRDKIEIDELQILIQSLYNVILPKLIQEDQINFLSTIQKFLPNFKQLETDIDITLSLKQLATASGLRPSALWLQKCHQVFEIQKLHTGLMLVGKSGTGKTVLFKNVLKAIQQVSKKENLVFTLDPKVIGKDSLFGTIDYATREWSDGIFTSIIRKAIESTKGEDKKHIWIIMDGDIEPEWVENLNSVLDDNKSLTLPNGEHLDVPDNLKIVFEVDSLKHTTPATVSRCGIVWFGNNLFSSIDHYEKLLFETLSRKVIDEEIYNDQLLSHNLSVNDYRDYLKQSLNLLVTENTVLRIESVASKYNDELHSEVSSKWSFFFTLLSESLVNLLDFIVKNTYSAHSDYFSYFENQIVSSIFWSFGGGFCYDDRFKFEKEMKEIPQFIRPLDSLNAPLMYSVVDCLNSNWVDIGTKVPKIDIDPHMVTKPDLVIPTTDTITYENTIFKVLNQHEPIILCGPPGAGKTMLLMSSIRKSSSFSLVSLNFSKETMPELIIKTLEHNCTYRLTSSGLLMLPPLDDKWLVIFCDELNLPKVDNYDSQIAISFLRGVIVHNGFWHPKKKEWVTLCNVQFVGACNPADGTTRKELSKRFQNKCNILMIDYPGKESLKQIYEVFSNAILRCVPDLIGYADTLTDSMIEVYYQYKDKFNESDRPHYICSPRELTRWIRGIFHGLKPLSTLSLEGLVRLWAHEGLRLFSDKLSNEDDRGKVFEIIHNVTSERFPYINEDEALKLPIIYSDWLSYEYEPIDKNDLRRFVKQKLEIFSEEEFNTNAILYEDLLEHSLRIDRVLKSTQGHLMLVGESGSGKTTLVKFIAWMNGIKSHQLNVFKGYTLKDFDESLKKLLWKSSIDNEKICFIIDESTILEASFLERMNTLLANAEIPGLFEGEDFKSLMSACSKASNDEGLVLETDEELYDWFTSQIANNFHVVFTMGDPYKEDSPLFIQSNALFNRCVINWMGNWSEKSLNEVSSQLLKRLPIDKFGIMGSGKENFRSSVISVFTSIKNIGSSIGLDMCQSPITFINMLNAFVDMYVVKETDLQRKKNHTNTGLDKMKETFLKVKKLNQVLTQKKIELAQKEKDARLVLDKMIMDQNESERKQDMSIEMQKIFTKQEQRVKEKRDSVKKELDEVEPLIHEAQQGVQNIKKQHLTEMRSMRNPPDTIKMVLESVCILLGFDVKSWADVQQVVRQDDFIASIVTYDGESQLTSDMIEFMEANYLSKGNYTYESANRASKALVPLMMWVKAQLRYASIVSKVEPLRKELQRLEIELLDGKNKLIAVDSMITDLQNEIETYKLRYSESIRDIESIKMEMKTVELKVTRSIKLLDSLKSERIRWKSNIDQYEEESRFFIGDLILNSIFTTHCGNLIEIKRVEFVKHIMLTLDDYGIQYDPKYEVLTKLSNPTSILEWQNNNLPNDNQFLENVSLLNTEYYKSYPILIDPTGQMIEFLNKSIKSLVVTSFLDDGYVQKLENCIKFGGSILIKNGECYDPILNRLIGNDVTLLGGGRQLVKIGDREIDFDSRFKLFIHTKDATIKLFPFLQNRVKLLNFKFTNETILNEGLNLVLNSERPEVESQRLELLKTKDQYKDTLRGYERDLLTTINDSTDDILDNDELVQKLESLKVKSDEMSLKSIEVENIIETFHNVINEFKPLGELYVDMTNTVNSLWKININYRFAQQYTKLILIDVLRGSLGQPITKLNRAFIEKVYHILSTRLLKEDIETLKQILNKLCEKHLIEEFQWIENTIEGSIMPNKFNLMRSSPGFDPSVIIQQLNSGLSIPLNKYSMGQINGLNTAVGLIMNAMKNDEWVIIENIEMSNELITAIPKLIEESQGSTRGQFKLFMTSKLDAMLPSLILETCNQIIIESPNGVKSIMANHLINPSYPFNVLQDSESKELKVIYFGILWIYSIINEELKFNPLTFKNWYDINETDLMIALKFAKSITLNISNGDLYEGMIPFESIRKMISEILFGGKVSDSGDKLRLHNVVDKVLTSGLFDDVELVKGVNSPGGKVYQKNEITKWVQNLPNEDPLIWFGLEESVKESLEEEKKRISEIKIKKLMIS